MHVFLSSAGGVWTSGRRLWRLMQIRTVCGQADAPFLLGNAVNIFYGRFIRLPCKVKTSIISLFAGLSMRGSAFSEERNRLSRAARSRLRVFNNTGWHFSAFPHLLPSARGSAFSRIWVGIFRISRICCRPLAAPPYHKYL